jgi:opacity protein-like surface antigen
MNTKASLLGLLTATLLSSTAFAADINGGSLKDGADVFTPKSVNWTGFYIGGSVGYGNSNHDLSVKDYHKEFCDDGFDRHGDLQTEPDKGDRSRTLGNVNSGVFEEAYGYLDTPITPYATCEEIAVPGHADTLHKTVAGGTEEVGHLDGVNAHGLVGDVRLGYDLAYRRFLFGVFGSYGFNQMEADGSRIGSLNNFSLEKGDEWSVGARAGLVVAPRTLAYILAAYTQTDYELTGTLGKGDDATGFSRETTFDGVTVGGGVEFALTSNIFLGIEGTHTFYGEETIFSAYNPALNSGIRLDDDLSETKVMGTLKIKLNGGTGLGF